MEWDALIVLDFEATCDEGYSPAVTAKNQVNYNLIAMK